MLYIVSGGNEWHLTQYFMLVSYLLAISHPRNIFIPTVIATKIQKMHDQDPEVYPPSRIGAAPLARTTALSLLLCVPMIMAGIVLSNPTAPFNALRAGRPYLFGWLGKHRLQLIIGVS